MAFGLGRKASVAGAATLLCLAAGCAGSSADAGRAGPCHSPGVSAGAIKVGLVYPDTGALAAAFATARGGFEARIDLANQQGGVHGRRVEVVWGDDAGALSGNLAVAQDLVQKSGVFALAELTTVASGSAPYLAKAGVPVVGLATEPSWSQYDNMFSTSYDVSDQKSISTYGDFIAAHGGKKAAIVEDQGSPATRAATNTLITSLTAAGIQVVARIPYTAGVTSAVQTASKIEVSRADVLIGELGADSISEIVAATHQAGLRLKVVLSGSVYDKTLLARYGADLAGMTAYITHLPFESNAPAVTTFRSAVRRFSPEIDDPDQSVVLGSYGQADLLLRGLEVAGACPTRQAFITNLRSVHDFNAAGFLPGGIDLSTNRGSPTVCLAFLTVNAQGTAFEIDQAPDGKEQWCGTRLGT
ncbi:ABC transporter substrate-binding protein [Pseudofrankia inefficax]|uniref:Leucine-binding protein domain-containing protein n=1 Tax=Pseudofrankia inefficax (strain DSM 45817 / CECT 9037 / DDB 130130 / EuI1c) TaxID=298654 RepID=E3JAJ9_PSEI1|nr:ABC transporter substrate-binding protein [Pseudofrankia inefficax]ADP82191.1 hypothetical protein FraEuI1c_4192 [Pseudofrankia inefficax]